MLEEGHVIVTILKLCVKYWENTQSKFDLGKVKTSLAAEIKISVIEDAR